MKLHLHILNQAPDELVAQILRSSASAEDVRVEVADLTVAQPDYARLVEQIFAADAVSTW